VLFASSVAVYGGELPDTVTDDTALDPKSSYGIQKLIGELLLNDFSRKGFIDGRGVRLPTICVRPGKPNQAASSFASSIIREPLQGQDAVCPVRPDTRLWLLSPRQAIDCLIWAHELDAAAYPAKRVINLPGVSVSVAAMIATLAKVAGPEAAARIHMQSDAVVQRIVGSWPAAWDMSRARQLGFTGDQDFESIVRAFITDDLAAAV
jgi:nucleoside-diphosphate-sugar epimerase